MTILTTTIVLAHDTEAYATRFHATVKELAEEQMGDPRAQPPGEVVYSDSREFLWEDNQSVSCRAATMKALQRFVEACRMECPF